MAAAVVAGGSRRLLGSGFRATQKHLATYGLSRGHSEPGSQAVAAACNWSLQLQQSRGYAARRGTREKARKSKKVKVEVKKMGFVPQLKKKARVLLPHEIVIDDSHKSLPIDDVYYTKYYRWPVYSFEEAVQLHRELHHPEIYDQPNAYLNALIEFNLQGDKKTKMVNVLGHVVGVPHLFPLQHERRVLAFCKSPELQEQAEAVGADCIAGSKSIRDIQEGTILLSDYDYVVAHPEMMPEIISIKGLLKKKFPNTKIGNLGGDIAELINKFKRGIVYTIQSHPQKLDYGTLETQIGTLDMDIEHLDANLKVLIDSINKHRPKRAGPFITRIRLVSKPSPEMLKIDLSRYIPEEQEKDEDDEEMNEGELKIVQSSV